jgi:hypothetical protein
MPPNASALALWPNLEDCSLVAVSFFRTAKVQKMNRITNAEALPACRQAGLLAVGKFVCRHNANAILGAILSIFLFCLGSRQCG